MKTVFAGALAAVLAGCASYPIAQNLRQQAQPLTIQDVAANPSASVGKVVIWGGVIINNINATNQASLYLLAFPLRGNGRPDHQARSIGRFIARGNSFLDPAEFKDGRLITVAGRIIGVERLPLQKTYYTYPVVGIDEIHLWHPRPPAAYYYPAFGWGPEWGWGPDWDLYGPWMGPPIWVGPRWGWDHGGHHR